MQYKLIIAAALASLVMSCGPAKLDANTKDNAEPKIEAAPVLPQTSVDERIVVKLSDLQRDHVLTQMRTMLDSTQQIVEGLAEGDMQKVEDAAYISGFKLSRTPEHRAEMGGLQMNKALPPEFRQMSRTTRMMFDEVSEMAARGESALEIQKVFSEGLYGCNACHSTFQIPTP